jgi:hypothetical protein
MKLRCTDVPPDGNCLFSALALNFPRRVSPSSLRLAAVTHLRRSQEELGSFFDETDPSSSHAHTMSQQSVWGGEEEIRAVSDSFHVRIDVFTDALKVLTYGEQYKDIVRIGYVRRSHYVALSIVTELAANQATFPARVAVPKQSQTLRDVCCKLHVEDVLRKLSTHMRPELTVQQWNADRRKLDQLFLGDVPYTGATEFLHNPLRFWTHVMKNGEDPLIAPLAVKLLSLPATEATCERSFSYLRRVWNVHSRRLSVRSAELRLQAKLGTMSKQPPRTTE